MSDLIERLREADAKLTRYCDVFLACTRNDVSDARLMSQAADEIERLQAEIDSLTALADSYQDGIQKLEADEEKQQREYDSLWESFCKMRADLAECTASHQRANAEVEWLDEAHETLRDAVLHDPDHDNDVINWALGLIDYHFTRPAQEVSDD